MKNNLLKAALGSALGLLALCDATAAPSYTLRVPVIGLRAQPPTTPDSTSWVAAGSPTTDFGSVQVGAFATPDLTFNVKNAGTNTASYAVPSFTGSDAADFSATGSCQNIAAGQLCPVTVRFKPSRGGAETASLAVGPTSTLTFTGTGIAGTSDPYYANIALLTHMDGTDGGTAFPSQKGANLAGSGATTSTAGPKFGSASARFSNSSYLTSPMTSGLNLGAHATWTAEYFFKADSFGVSVMLAGYQDTNNRWTFELAGTNAVSVLTSNSAATRFTTAQTMTAGTWYHFAVVRQNGATRVFLNGQEATPQGSTASNVSNIPGGSFNVARVGTNAYFFPGNIDELRITPDVARYTGPFTPPTQAFPDQ